MYLYCGYQSISCIASVLCLCDLQGHRHEPRPRIVARACGKGPLVALAVSQGWKGLLVDLPWRIPIGRRPLSSTQGLKSRRLVGVLGAIRASSGVVTGPESPSSMSANSLSQWSLRLEALVDCEACWEDELGELKLTICAEEDWVRELPPGCFGLRYFKGFSGVRLGRVTVVLVTKASITVELLQQW